MSDNLRNKVVFPAPLPPQIPIIKGVFPENVIPYKYTKSRV
jgi:hypothetical protein